MVECDKCKDKPCCKDEIMSVQLSLDFLFRLAEKLDIKPEEVFNKYCQIEALNRGDFLFPAKIALKSPCIFFNGECTINSIKPLTCLYFPASASDERSFLYGNFPCINGTLEKVSDSELKICKEISPIADDANIFSDNIHFKLDRPIIDIRSIRSFYPKVDEYCKWLEERIEIENETIDERDKRQLQINKIASEEINKGNLKQTVFIRIRMIKPEIKAKIHEINDKYFKLRKHYNI